MTTLDLSFLVRGSSRRPKSPPPAFCKRKVASSLESVPVVAIVRLARSSASVPTLTVARSARPSTPSAAASALVSSPPVGTYHLMDEEGESLPCCEDLVPHKRRSMDVDDGVTQAIGSIVADYVIRETTTIVLEDDVELSS